MNTYDQLLKLKKLNSICLIGHVKPDPDAFCSMVALREFLLNEFNIPIVNIYAECNSIPEDCKPILENIELNAHMENYDCAIIMDAPTICRTGKYESLFNSAPLKGVIDHHNTNELSLDITIVEETSSTCEIIYSIFKYFNYNPPKETKGKLYAGLITDTNNFTVGKFGKRTYQMASDYVEDINYKNIYSHFLSKRNLKEMKALACTIQNIQTYYNNRIIYTFISDKEYADLNLKDEDCVVIVNNLNTITEADIICFVRPRDDGYYVSMRAKQGFNVADVAKANGGGGHIGAAGFQSTSSISEICSQLIEEFKDQMSLKRRFDNKLF